VSNCDKICRCAVYPQFIKESTGLFDEDMLVAFKYVDNRQPHLGAALSVTTLATCRDEKGVHLYGIRTADAANQNAKQRNGGELPEEKTRKYLGYYHCPWDTPRTLGIEYFFVRLRWKPENGQSEHLQLEARAKADKGGASKADYKREIRQIRNALFQKLSGPCLQEAPKGSVISELQRELPVARAS
jgi:hypothetical protein